VKANFRDVVETKRRTDIRLKVALAALQKIYDESTDDSISLIAGLAFDAATNETSRTRSPAPSGEMKKIICHAEGDRCLGCSHYQGKSDKCEFDSAPSGEMDAGRALADELERDYPAIDVTTVCFFA